MSEKILRSGKVPAPVISKRLKKDKTKGQELKIDKLSTIGLEKVMASNSAAGGSGAGSSSSGGGNILNGPNLAKRAAKVTQEKVERGGGEADNNADNNDNIIDKNINKPMTIPPVNPSLENNSQTKADQNNSKNIQNNNPLIKELDIDPIVFNSILDFSNDLKDLDVTLNARKPKNPPPPPTKTVKQPNKIFGIFNNSNEFSIFVPIYVFLLIFGFFYFAENIMDYVKKNGYLKTHYMYEVSDSCKNPNYEVNIASKKLGGEVISSISPMSCAICKVWIFSKFCSKGTADTILEDTLDPNNFWCIWGNTGTAMIKLGNPTFLTGFTYKHKYYVNNEEKLPSWYNDAVKEFSITAYTDKEWKKGAEGTFIGNFWYAKTPEQTFKISKTKVPYRFIKLEIKSNHGEKYTNFYNIRVHGQFDLPHFN